MLICSSSINVFDNVLVLALIIVGIAIFVCTLIASFARMSIFWRYHKYNRVPSSTNLTGAQAARKLLDFKGMRDVEVKKASLLRAMIWGNSYAPNKKTIFLRRGIIDMDSVTAVTLAIQKVGLAEQHYSGDKKYKAYSKLIPYCPFIGVFFVPLVIVGLILDILFFNFSGVLSITVAIIGIVLYICAFILIILNVPVEKKATVLALKTMEESRAFTDEEMSVARKIYKSYITQYITDMLIAILELVKFILKLLLSLSKNKNK